MHGKRKFIKYCWQTSKKVSSLKNKSNSIYRVYHFWDLLYFGFKYNATTLDYLRLKYYEKSLKERRLLKDDLVENKEYKNRMDRERNIVSKYASIRYEHDRRWHKRNKKYKNTFGMGENCWVQYNVFIKCSHNIRGKLKIGDKVSLRRNVDLDYTGDLEIGNGVDFTEGVKVLTHGHDFLGMKADSEVEPNTNRAYLTKLTICDNVIIGTRSIIMPGVTRIGYNSIISANSLVTKAVPDNVIVAGNPAKVVAKIHEGMRAYYK